MTESEEKSPKTEFAESDTSMTLTRVTMSFFLFCHLFLPRGHIYAFIYNLYRCIDAYIHTRTQACHAGAGSGLKLLVYEVLSY
jgi:hypothetical protein